MEAFFTRNYSKSDGGRNSVYDHMTIWWLLSTILVLAIFPVLMFGENATTWKPKLISLERKNELNQGHIGGKCIHMLVSICFYTQ